MNYKLFLIPLLFFCLPAQAQDNYGSFDYDQVVRVLPFYDSTQNSIAQKSSQLQDSLDLLQREWDNFIQSGIPHGVKLDSSARAGMEQQILMLQKRIVVYQIHAQDELTKLKMRYDAELKIKLGEALVQFRTVNSIVILAETKAVLYCKGCRDYTNDIIEYLKSKK